MQIMSEEGDVLFEKVAASSGIFHFNVTKPGVYTFILSNEKVKQITMINNFIVV